ncbi:archaeal ATPase [bacterium BMS3Abin05]|nr:archaeal ATPase [bacterium BMS3Abin05]HDZ11210.1 ATP-binding protein [Bacteroidota bacterium]
MNIIETFKYQNPWRTNLQFQIQPYFERAVTLEIAKWLHEPEIIVITGPRQSGKTTILFKLIENLISNKVPAKSIFYFNCDDLGVRSIFKNIPDLVQFVNRMTEDSKPFLFIDEIQRVENPGLFLKQLYDLRLGYKILVSGSSSLEIRSKIKEYLTGRKIQFIVFPFDFPEFLAASGNFTELLKVQRHEIVSNFSHFDRIWGTALENSLKQYLMFGGYPRQLLTDLSDKKRVLIKEIFDSYINKDVTDFLRIENITGFNKLVQLVALTSGQIINKSNLALNAGINYQTLEKYLQILQDTFVIETVHPFFSNKSKEIVKNPKIYFLDPGLYNHAVNNFNDITFRADAGFLQEQFIFRGIKTIMGADFQLKFWRTKIGAEIDFIIEKGRQIIPVECKSLLKRPQLQSSALSFIKQYSPNLLLVANTKLFSETKIANTKIVFLPYHWFHRLTPIYLEKIFSY